MKLLVSGATKTVRRWADKRPDRVGVLLCPDAGRCWGLLDGSLTVASDNGCFGGLNAASWLRLLADLTSVPDLWWVTCPDVVGDSAKTLRQFGRWSGAIKELNLPVALVGQDGLTPESVPWGEVDAYFVGGSDAWKLSPESRRLVDEAKGRGLLVHMGRVNTMERFHVAAKWGCHTADGSSFSRWSDVLIPKAIRWIDAAVGGPLYSGLELTPPAARRTPGSAGPARGRRGR